MSDIRAEDCRFTVLGSLRGWRDEVELALGPPQQRAALVVLLLSRRSVTLEELVDGLWGEAPPAAAVNIVRTYVHRLRHVLPTGIIATVAGGYALEFPENALDSNIFAHQMTLAAEERQRGSLYRALSLTQEALSLWHGVALAGLPGPFAEAHRVRLSSLRLDAVEQRSSLEMQLGRNAEAVLGLSDLLARDPLREGPRELLMLALYRSSRQADALAVYDEGRKLLAGELGIAPGPRMQKIYQSILAADPELLSEREVRLITSGAPAQLPADLPDFIGREQDIETVTSIIRSPEQDLLVGIHGAAGVGKTTLAIRVGHLVREEFPDGHVFIDLARPDRQPIAVEPVLASIMGIFETAPEHDSNPSSLAEEWKSLSRRKQVLVILDGADALATLEPLRPGADSRSAVIVVAQQPIETSGDLYWHRVDEFSLQEGVELLARIAGSARVLAEPRAAGRLIMACGGLPLCIRRAGGRLVSRPAWTVAAMAERFEEDVN